jgi:hypothetical protein
MNTNPEESRTLGHLDPPRLPEARVRNFSARPFGTTHELVGRDPTRDRNKRKRDDRDMREIPLSYLEVTSPEAACAVAKAWLLKARQRGASENGIEWDSEAAGDDAPALKFSHGFAWAGMPPITRANDPFWNVRAFDTALARHDGYLLSSFICSINQLVMDDPGGHMASVPAAPPAVSAPTNP